jgi:amino-acid N-acetyltransferase
VVEVTVRAATAADLAGAERLLAATELPTEGVAEHWGDAYVVAERDGAIVGVAGVERYGNAGLLRSVAVDAALRGTGLGGRLVEDRLGWAEREGIRSLYLLTTTAAAWFPRYGFVPVARADVPAAVLAAPEFVTICASSATVLGRTSA